MPAVSRALIAAGLAGLASAFHATEVKFFMRKNIDPIVVPGRYVSHMHSFFGSDAVNVNMSTSAQLREGCSTANNPNDLSVYWIPTLYHVEGATRTAIEPATFTAYYGLGQDRPEIPFPEDIALLGGNANGQTSAELLTGSDVTWLCQGQPRSADGTERSQFPSSACETTLQAILRFPQCIDPMDTSRYAYAAATGGVCPDDMVTMPQLAFFIHYDTKTAIPEGWSGGAPLELSCGASHCFHGDFINGWLPDAAVSMLDAIDDTKTFLPISGANGRSGAGSICTREATDSDPENGTDDYEESLLAIQGVAPAATNGTTPVAAEETPNATPSPIFNAMPEVSEAPEAEAPENEDDKVPSFPVTGNSTEPCETGRPHGKGRGRAPRRRPRPSARPTRTPGHRSVSIRHF